MKKVSKALAVLLAGVLVLAMSGCSWSKASVAFQIGDKTVTVAEVDALADALFETYALIGSPVSHGVAEGAAVQALVFVSVLDSVPEAAEMVIPASMTDPVLALATLSESELAQQNATDVMIVKNMTDVPRGIDWLRGQLAVSRVQNDLTSYAAFTSLGPLVNITINPRYGSWNAETGLFEPNSGSLSDTFESQLSQETEDTQEA